MCMSAITGLITAGLGLAQMLSQKKPEQPYLPPPPQEKKLPKQEEFQRFNAEASGSRYGGGYNSTMLTGNWGVTPGSSNTGSNTLGG